MRLQLLILLVLLSAIVQGAGLGPSRKEITTGPGMTYDSYMIVSADEYPAKVRLVLDGDIQGLILLEKAEYQISEPMTKIEYKIEIPEDTKPGSYQGAIRAAYISDNQGQISIELELSHQLWITVEDNRPDWLLIFTLMVIAALVFILLKKFMTQPPEKDYAELKAYISDMRKRNIPDKDIEEKLMTVGWPRNIIRKKMKR